MNKLVKIVLGLVAAIAVLIAAGGVLLSIFFDPNHYKDEIRTLARDNAQLELDIQGQIDWSVFPWLGLSINDINVRFIDQPELAKLKQAQVSVSLPALLSGKVEMQQVLIDGLDLTLVQAKEGANNWSAPASETSTSTAATDGAASDNSSSSAGSGFALDIEKVQLSNATLRYTDETTGQTTEVTQLNLETGRIAEGSPFPLSLAAAIKQAEQTTQIDLSSTLTLRNKDQYYQLDQLQGNVTLQGDKPLTLTLALPQLVADLKAQTLNAEQFTVTLANLTAKGSLKITDLSKQALHGSLEITPFALNPLLETLGQAPVTTANSNALQKISLKTQFTGDEKQIKADQLTLALDSSTFNGNAAYQLQDGHIALSLAGDSLNIDHYLPPQNAVSSGTAGNSNTTSTNSTGYSKEEVIALEPLQQLNLTAALKLQSAIIQQVQMSNLDVAISARNGLIKAERFNAKAYGGQISNQFTLDARKAPLKISSKKRVTGLQLAALLKETTGDAPITGTLSSSSDITAQGQSVHSLINSLNGTANVTLTDGVIQGIDMAQQLCQTINNLSALGSVQPAQSVDSSTPFAKMGGNFVIRNGVVSNNDLNAQLDAMTVKGKGSIDLPASLMDYQLGLIIQENLFKKTCPVNNRLEGVEWPVRCKGAFSEPPAELCKPDARAIRDILKKVVADKVKEELSKKVENKLEEQLKDKLGGDEAVKGLLKGLFK